MKQPQFAEAGDLAHSLCCSPERPSVFNRIRNQKESLYNFLSISETSDFHGVESGRLNKSYRR